MKIPFTAARVAVIAALFLGVFAGSASATNEPIPGVDVIVRKKPGGIAMHATTDSSGHFVFENLAAGTYTLAAAAPQTRAAISTTRSNIKHSSVSVTNGVQVVTVSVEIGTGSASAEIEITSAKGKITGTVNRATATKKEPALGGPDTTTRVK